MELRDRQQANASIAVMYKVCTGTLQEMEALLSGTGPLSESLRRNDPYHPAGPSSPPFPEQQSQQQLHQAQQQQQAQPPIRVSLLPGPLKLLTPTQVKELSWQNHLKLYKVTTAP